MSRRLPVEAAPGALESFAQAFDELLERRNQRELFRRYLEGLLLPSERNKTLTGLANTEPVTGAQKAAAQKLQWFLSESSWDPDVVNDQRLQMLMAHPTLKPHAQGALVIDETGDRKWGTKTAFVGRQYLGSIGKIDNGVVSVQALWADEQLYYPLVFEPFTPAGWFTDGKNDPEYRTKPQLALRLVQHAQAQGVPFEAVVADSLYGEHREFKKALSEQGILFVVMLKPLHDWYHFRGEVGCVKDIAEAQPWQQDTPGAWQQVTRSYRDGREETWWLLEASEGPFRPERQRRLMIATTDPRTLPELSTVYLETNAPVPGTPWAQESKLQAKDVREVFRLYTLRYWVEQSYKQVKGHLGWTEYQVRSPMAIKRHWQLVFCAFTFCWWAAAQEGLLEASSVVEPEVREKKKLRDADVASGIAVGALLPGAVPTVVSLLESILDCAPTRATRSAS
jgi:hypothetical protein